MSTIKVCEACKFENESETKYCASCGSINLREKLNPARAIPLWDKELLPELPGRYRVITMKDRFFGGKFDPSLLQNALNEYANDGWRLTEAVSAEFPGGLGGSRNEIVMIMERVNWDESAISFSASIESGVLFLTGDLPGYLVSGSVESNINRQNAQLSNLRESLAELAVSNSANVVTNFTDSQRGHKPISLMNPFKWDTEGLSGFGNLAFVPKERMQGVIEEIFGV